ncbi:cupin domain-containing protein [Blastococcus brunescens]|uniref:Cupin domain-containing protein n=1 Tax=Blastococcus brunescens TaxID=1564165 RepID=A0ABZ1B5V1_9ACTN|nr:cupin domain-containing protein [Blastococcus sp. BMG 8361]WRL65228.1 cupin domain-containing protein [Blastococcus sp. BMG 8361]
MTTPGTVQQVPVVHAPGEGTAIWHLDTLMTFKALSGDTGGRLAVWEQLLPHRSSPPLHVHSEDDEAWFVLDGELTFQVADRTWSATEGSFVWAPRGLPHTFRVDSPRPTCSPSPSLAGSTGSCGPPADRRRPRPCRPRRTAHRTWPRWSAQPGSTGWRCWDRPRVTTPPSPGTVEQ